jgi:hypothetical protein
MSKYNKKLTELRRFYMMRHMNRDEADACIKEHNPELLNNNKY